jgi:hypothetical protein
VDKEAEGEDASNLWKQCENLESQLGDNPASMLYSENREEGISYRERVMEMEKDKDDFLYSMAGHKGETVESLGIKTVSDLYSFAERFNEELKNGRR